MRTQRTLWILLALAVALSGCSNDLLAPSTGTVYGKLIYENAKPAAGVDVLIEGLGLRAVTDDKGQFIINNVLAVNEDGMGRMYTVRGYCKKDGEDMGFLVGMFKVKGAQSYSIGTVTVRPTGRAIGTVYMPDGEDHSGTTIAAMGTSLMTTTRADGSFVLDKLPPAEKYALVCMRDGFATVMLMPLDSAMSFGIEPHETAEMAPTTMRPPR